MGGISGVYFCFFFQAEDGIRDIGVTGVQTCALPILVPCLIALRILGFHSYFVCAVIVILLSSALVENPAFSQAAKKGPFIDQARFIHRVDENLALEEVKSGFLDTYFFPIPQEAANNAKNDPRLKVYDKTAGSLGFFVNPAPAAGSNVLNPFQFKEVRYALNYLIDREFVINEILKGYGSPLVDPFGIYSPEYLNIIGTVESFGFRYNPSLASSMISGAMNAAGATNNNGKWQFNGSPVTVKVLIRQRSEEHTSELQSRQYLVCRLLLEKKKITPSNLFLLVN